MWKVEASWKFICTQECQENKASYPIMEEVLEKSEFIYSMGYYTAIKKMKIKTRHIDRKYL